MHAIYRPKCNIKIGKQFAPSYQLINRLLNYFLQVKRNAYEICSSPHPQAWRIKISGLKSWLVAVSEAFSFGIEELRVSLSSLTVELMFC